MTDSVSGGNRSEGLHGWFRPAGFDALQELHDSQPSLWYGRGRRATGRPRAPTHVQLFTAKNDWGGDAAATAEPGRPQAHGSAVAAGGGSSLSCSNGSNRGTSQLTSAAGHTEQLELQVRGKSCKCLLCGSCGPGIAAQLAERIASTLVGRDNLVMLCGTIDPVQFPNQRAIHDHLCRKKVRSELPKHLRRLGLIERGFYWVFLEFQNGSRRQGGGPATQQCHFHWIVQLTPNAKWGDVFWAMKDFWDRQRPAGAGPVPAGRPALGRIDKVKPIVNVAGMARYFCAYFGDARRKGIPRWYLDRCEEGHYLRLASHASGMFPCDRREVEPKPDEKTEVKKRKIRSVHYRMSWCLSEAMFLEHWMTVDINGEIVHEDFKYLGDLVPGYEYLWEEHIRGSEFDVNDDGELVERKRERWFPIDDEYLASAVRAGWLRPAAAARRLLDV